MIWAIVFSTLSIVAFGFLLWCAGPDDSWMVVAGGLCLTPKKGITLKFISNPINCKELL